MKKEVNNYGDLLEVATGKECLVYKKFGSYQGDYIAILKSGDGVEIWKGKYGSCTVCDWLIGAKTFENGKSVIKEERAKEYLKEREPFLKVRNDDIETMVQSDDIKAFFPRNTRNDYADWDWDDIRELLKEAQYS